MGTFFGTSPSDTSTTTNDIPDWQKPYVEDYMAQAKQLQNNQPTYMPSQGTTQGIGALGAIAGQDTLGQNAATNLNSTLNGDYLYGGEGFNAAFDAAKRKIMPSIGAAFTKAGQYGDSSGRDLAQTQALGDIFASQYAQERSNQMNAAQLAPSVASAQYMPAQQTLAAGSLQDQIARQPYLDKWNALNQYKGATGGSYGNQSSTPVYTNYAGQALGLASMFM